jgi:hypothetical protein
MAGLGSHQQFQELQSFMVREVQDVQLHISGLHPRVELSEQSRALLRPQLTKAVEVLTQLILRLIPATPVAVVQVDLVLSSCATRPPKIWPLMELGLVESNSQLR